MNKQETSKYTSLQIVQQDLKSQKITLEKLVQYYLKQIDVTSDLNAYVEVYEEEALKRALDLDKKFKANPDSVGKLFGMVIAIKDVICYKDHEITAASKILEGFTSLFSATAIERILAEDAIIIGRVNCDQFAMGSTNENSIYGAVKNAANTNHVAGGSSGGSAVAVQADTCLAALGSDTGGSVRQPAAFCGNIGFKPTYGRISRHGLIAYASSFDQIGVITKSIFDAAILLEVMAGSDDYDSTASASVVPSYSSTLSKDAVFKKKTKIAYFESALNHKSLDTIIRQKTNDLIKNLKEAGHEVEAVEFDLLDYLIPTYYVLTTAEASSNLARFDGIRYGHRSPNATNFQETYLKSRTEGFSEEVKRRIMLGSFVLSSGYYDAYYTKAQQVRRLITEKTRAILAEYDFILMPTAPTTAFKLGDTMKDPVEMYLADIYTVQANLTGIPAVSIPLGIHSNNLPFGVQFFADKFQEESLLAFAQYVNNTLIEGKFL
ncbi:MAG: Asp-tRNA(Asn)/Glu-tRNA(Gln) amidotransferase subunit GatA [Saprospiraceae bacterium]